MLCCPLQNVHFTMALQPLTIGSDLTHSLVNTSDRLSCCVVLRASLSRYVHRFLFLNPVTHFYESVLQNELEPDVQMV